eukprot:Nitzschia sp. Nitz4//scaffold2_size372955//324301//324851//NITZ4_000467-RA/size372955-snap-gene-0.108-mRNA-1//-1//CDS//3329546910//9436//frame0
MRPGTLAFQVVYLLLLLLALLPNVVLCQIPTAHQEVLESRENRRIKLERSLERAQEKLEQYNREEISLEPHQVEHFIHKIGVYKHQMEEFARELDDTEIRERIAHAERVRQKITVVPSEEL